MQNEFWKTALLKIPESPSKKPLLPSVKGSSYGCSKKKIWNLFFQAKWKHGKCKNLNFPLTRFSFVVGLKNNIIYFFQNVWTLSTPGVSSYRRNLLKPWGFIMMKWRKLVPPVLICNGTPDNFWSTHFYLVLCFVGFSVIARWNSTRRIPKVLTKFNPTNTGIHSSYLPRKLFFSERNERKNKTEKHLYPLQICNY